VGKNPINLKSRNRKVPYIGTFCYIFNKLNTVAINIEGTKVARSREERGVKIDIMMLVCKSVNLHTVTDLYRTP